VACPVLLTLDRPKEVIFIGILIYLVLAIAYTIRALFACCYLTITDTKIVFINPYIRFYREFCFLDIARAKIAWGGIYADKTLFIWDKNGKRFYKEIALVANNDLKEIVGIFIEHGINVDKDSWTGFLE